jgi:hypothetical protein
VGGISVYFLENMINRNINNSILIDWNFIDLMLNHLIWLNETVYFSALAFFIFFIFSCVVLYFLFFSIKDLIVDYLPDLLHTLSAWKNIFLVLSISLIIVFFHFY